jgi:hypothetical protein
MLAGYILPIVAIALMMVPQVGKLEGAFWPVTTGFAITDISEADKTSSYVSGVFFIARGSCSFRGVEWYVKGADRDILLYPEFPGQRVRPAGANEFGPWIIGQSVGQIAQYDAEIHALHQCPRRPWLTRTVLFEGKIKQNEAG